MLSGVNSTKSRKRRLPGSYYIGVGKGGLFCLLQEQQVVDDVGIVLGDLGISTVGDQLGHSALDGGAQFGVTRAERDTVLLGAEALVNNGEAGVLSGIGGGDGFVGGMLYAILKGWESGKWIQFGWATGALATTFLTDYAQPYNEDQIWNIWNGNARVKR